MPTSSSRMGSITWDVHRPNSARISGEKSCPAKTPRQCAQNIFLPTQTTTFFRKTYGVAVLLSIVQISSQLLRQQSIHHVVRRNRLAGYQPAILLLQAQVLPPSPITSPFLTRPEQPKRRTSAATNTMSPASATDNPAPSPTPAMPLSAHTPSQARCTSI